MTEFWARRKFHTPGLVPISVEDDAQLAKLPYDKDLFVSVRKPRNAQHHRLFWAVCNRMGEALHVNPDNIAALWKLATGHYEIVRTKSFGDVKIPKSISFAAMDQTAFKEFFDRGVLMLYEEWGIARPEVLAAVSDILEPTETRG